MNNVIICYSLGGTSLRFAKGLQQQNGDHLIEIKEARNRSILNAYLVGAGQAMRGKRVKLSQSLPDLKECDRIALVFPVWAGYPAPSFNNVVAELPKGKTVTVYLISASGQTNEKHKEKIKGKILAKGCELERIRDVKNSAYKK